MQMEDERTEHHATPTLIPVLHAGPGVAPIQAGIETRTDRDIGFCDLRLLVVQSTTLGCFRVAAQRFIVRDIGARRWQEGRILVDGD